MDRTDGSISPSGGDDDRLPALEGTVVAMTVHCRGCGYDLRGLAGDGRCPECGLEVERTVQALVDPEASTLPRLRNPRRIGNGLWGLIALSTLAALLVAAQPIAFLAAADRWPVPLSVPRDFSLLSAVAALLGLASVLWLHPARRGDPAAAGARDVRLLGLAGTAWSAAAALLWWRQGTVMLREPPSSLDHLDRLTVAIHLGLVAAGGVWMLGMGGILAAIGRRSRAYRHSRSGRQRVHALIGALCGVAIGELIRLACVLLPAADRSPSIFSPRLSPAVLASTVIVWVSVLMVCIGLLYMVVNGWWIRRDLRRRPPRLGSVLRRGP